MIERSHGREAAQNLITVFSVGEIRFAIRVEHLSEIIQLSGISIEADKKYMLGSVVLRGNKIPVMDFQKVFGVTVAEEDSSLRSMIIFKRNGRNGPEQMGAIIDRIEGVHREDEMNFFPFPEIAQNSDTTVYQGMLVSADNLILFLDASLLMERVLAAR